MFYHSYDSIDDIEPEFILSLEQLLKDKSPSFEFIKANEKDESDSTYYLFFGTTDNVPKAFLKSRVEKTNAGLISKILPFAEKKVIKWSGPKTYSDAFIVDPKFKNEFTNQFKQLATTESKKLKLKGHKLISPIPLFKEVSSPVTYLKSLFKSKETYEEYIKSLSSGLQKEITLIFKEHKSLKIKKYESLQECFNYKKKSKDDYIRIKKQWPYNLLKESTHSIMSLESNEQVLAFTVLIKNDKNHCFFHTNNLLEIVNDKVLLQLALILFYEDSSLLYLHSLNKIEFNKNYEQLNFDSYVEKEYFL